MRTNVKTVATTARSHFLIGSLIRLHGTVARDNLIPALSSMNRFLRSRHPHPAL